MSAATLAQRLDRAIALGAELREIDVDPDLHRLSREAWIGHSMDLAGFNDFEALKSWQRKIETDCPMLWREISIRARLWRDNPPDRPGLFRFLDPERWPAVYAEMLVSGCNDKIASSIASVLVGESRADETFGKLNSWVELGAMIGPKHAELGTLDHELAQTVRAIDLDWSTGHAELRHAGFVVVVDQGNINSLASAIADTAMRMVAPASVDAA